MSWTAELCKEFPEQESLFTRVAYLQKDSPRRFTMTDFIECTSSTGPDSTTARVLAYLEEKNIIKMIVAVSMPDQLVYEEYNTIMDIPVRINDVVVTPEHLHYFVIVL